jgi:hypothetical protein
MQDGYYFQCICDLSQTDDDNAVTWRIQNGITENIQYESIGMFEYSCTKQELIVYYTQRGYIEGKLL